MKKVLFLFLSVISLLSCKQRISISGQILNRPPFEQITGLHFSEVRRSFTSGYVFSKEGYQLEPEWRMFFMSDDSMQAYSPLKKRFIKFKITYSHDSVFNFAGQWFKLKQISRDSLLFQLLEVHNREISNKWSNVLMSFYSDDYIKKKLHTTLAVLQRPRRKDSLYIKAKAIESGIHLDSAFAARVPAVLKSNSPQLEIQREGDSKNPLETSHSYDYYYNPRYEITIHNTYKDFKYYFWGTIDNHGKIWYGGSLYVEMPEFKEAHARMTKFVISNYLHRFLDITPGSTLGYIHPSYVTLTVTGKK